MALGRSTAVWTATLAATALGAAAWASAPQQSTTAGAHAGAQTQSVPDAPQPKTLPDLNTLTPLAPAVNAPAPAPTAPAATQEKAPPSALPSAPAPTAEAQQDAQAPEVAAPGQGPKLFTLRQQVNFVEVPFTVKDSKGNLLPGISWRDVRVYENGVEQHKAYWTTDPFPMSVALVIDQSVTFDTMEKVNASLAALQGAFTPYDEVSVFTYSNGVRRQTGFTGAQSARLGVILDRSKVRGREPLMPLGGPMSVSTYKNGHGVDPNTDTGHGMTSFEAPPKEYHTLNDAILAAAQETANAPRGRRRIVYVIGEGREYGSKAKEKEVIHYLQANNVAVYATVVGDTSLPGIGFLDRIHLPLTMRDDVLPRYAAATGGQVDPEFRPKGIEASFAKISETVRTQYTVGYYSHEPILDGKYRSIEVRVLRPSLSVIAKPGYYPNARDSAPRPVAAVPTATP